MKWQQGSAGEPWLVWFDSGVCIFLQNVPVTMAFATMDCEGMGAASASRAGRAPPAEKVRECEGPLLYQWQRNLRHPIKFSEQLRLL